MDKRILGPLAIIGLGTLLLVGTTRLQARRYNHSGITTNVNGPINSCNDLEFTFDERPAAVTEEHFTIPPSGQALRVDAANNGGVEVIGGSGSEYAVSACKAAASDELLKEVSVSKSGNNVTANGPGGSEWEVYFIVKTPKDANLHVEAHNGPISLREVKGKVEAHSMNGPISVKECSGDIEARTQNGPISMTGRDGTLDLETQNGPINVALAGNRWGSGKVNARTQNGPLDLSVPEKYDSGVRVEMSGHSPVTCHAAQCSRANRTWDDSNRYIEFGAAEPQIRMSTVNGPVSVGSD